MKHFSHLRTHRSQWKIKWRGTKPMFRLKIEKRRWFFSGNNLQWFLLVQCGHQNFYIGRFI